MKNLLPSFQQETDFVVAAFSNDMLPNAMKVPANAPARFTPACGPHHYAPKKKIANTPRDMSRGVPLYVPLHVPLYVSLYQVAALLRKAGATVDMQQEPKKKVCSL